MILKRNDYNLFKLVLLAALLSSVFSATYLYAQETTRFAGEIELLEQFIAKQMEYDRTPGLSIAIYKDDFTWSKGYGYADLENMSPAKAVSAYRLASITKPMTALAILKLAEDGKLSLDAEVQQYVPWFPKKSWPVTVRLLLGHLGGISHYRDYNAEGHLKTHHDTREAIAIFQDWELVAEPGTRFNYSSYGFNLLGAVIEGASGQTYGDYMRENIWDPLGMDDTRMDSPEDLIPNRVRGYRIIRGEIKNSEFVDMSSRFAGGGTRSTVVDLIKLARGLDDGKIISGKSADEMYTSMSTVDGRYTGYGMGWRTGYVSGMWGVGHSGSQQETRTYLWRFPKEHFAVAVACNLETSIPGEYAFTAASIFQRLFDVGAETPSDEENAIYRALHRVWNYGQGYFNRHGTRMPADDAELADAFEYFFVSVDLDSIKTNPDDAMRAIADGVNPVAKNPYIKIGSYMAQKLSQKYGPAKMAYYQLQQQLAFFSDYAALCKSDPSIPEAFKLPAVLQQRVQRWSESWDRTWTDEVRGFMLRPIGDLDGVADKLKVLFAGAEIYPRFNDALDIYAYILLANGKLEQGLGTLLTAAELYPSDANLLESIGEFYLAAGDRAASIKYYRMALEKDPDLETAKRALKELEPAEQNPH